MAEFQLSRIKRDPRNPRKISQTELERLAQSIREFPRMMELRPIIYDKTGKIIAGDKRYLAITQILGMTAIPAEWVKKAADLSEEERRRFVVMDNHHAGAFDWDLLKTDWDLTELKDWGLEMPGTTPVQFNASKREKGTLVKVTCKDPGQAQTLFERLLKEGFEVVVK